MKTTQLQIRISPAQKAFLRRRAQAAGQDLSAYVLSRMVPDSAIRFEETLSAVRKSEGGRFALAALNDLLAGCPPLEFEMTVAPGLPEGLSAFTRNLVAAMVEQAASLKGVAPPAWARDVAPLKSPWFATDMHLLRAHLLRASPAAFRRRNLFVDATVGDRV